MLATLAHSCAYASRRANSRQCNPHARSAQAPTRVARSKMVAISRA